MGARNTHYGQILAVLILDNKKRPYSLVKEGLCVRRDLESVCESQLENQTVTQVKLGVLGVTLSITFRGSSLASRDSWKFLGGPRPAPQLCTPADLLAHSIGCSVGLKILVLLPWTCFLRAGVGILLRSVASFVLMLYIWNGEHLYGDFLLIWRQGFSVWLWLSIQELTLWIMLASDSPVSASRKVCATTPGFLGL